ncbi:hypothetical protein ACIP79_23710 [Streptomyces sp. NPDC088747]|uniref:hypothetical protein n=1 Tax=Streptomyces sp. NPDC088747 TaxID=3365886 RepID=UPI003801901A
MDKDCSDSLHRIHREFEENGNPADGYGDDLGSDKLRDVFDDFSETWQKNRKKLMKDIENLAKYTGNAAKAYEDIDHPHDDRPELSASVPSQTVPTVLRPDDIHVHWVMPEV